MKNPVKRAIADWVETGEYYKEAREWYSHRYLLPFSERAYCLLLLFILLLFTVGVSINMYYLFPIKREVPLLIEVEDSIDQYVSIYPLSRYDNNARDTLRSVLHYLVSNYVLIREQYPKKAYLKDILERQANFINSNSSRNVSSEFAHYIDSNNPKSPVLLLRDQGARLIKITSVTFDGLDDNISRASIGFEATTTLGNTSSVSKWKADLSFTFTDFNVILQSKAPLEFQVTYYKSQPL